VHRKGRKLTMHTGGGGTWRCADVVDSGSFSVSNDKPPTRWPKPRGKIQHLQLFCSAEAVNDVLYYETMWSDWAKLTGLRCRCWWTLVKCQFFYRWGDSSCRHATCRPPELQTTDAGRWIGFDFNSPTLSTYWFIAARWRISLRVFPGISHEET
jgi:hypothetical protein